MGFRYYKLRAPISLYCARTLDLDVFTQSKTMDEVMANLRGAVDLHLEGEHT